jgi:hypothetical protein
MLEQAIIDAEALREAAIKNAEQEVLEKYSGEIKEAVDNLLEQEDELGLDDVGEEESIVDQMPMSATAGEKLCPCPEDEEPVVLDLDQLVAAAEEAEEEEQELEMDASDDLGDDEEELFEVNDDNILQTISEILSEDEDEDEDAEVDEKPDFLDMDGDGNKDESFEDAVKDKEKKKQNESLELGISEQELDKMIEALVVDIENVPHGLNFHSIPTKAEDEHGLDVALAKEQDSEYAEEQKELRDAIKKLQEQVNSQKLELNEQKKEYNKIKSIAIKATKKLEEVNFSNAKLIYTNRILKSDSLNERQKDKLVEAISKVGSVEEAKIVFEALKENLSPSTNKAPKNLSEAVSKNNQLVLKSNNEKQPASNNQVSRLKRLAGIN